MTPLTELSSRILVAVPTLNEAATIEACLRSLLAGDALADVQLIVADGGSTDGTAEIVEGLSQKDARVSLVQNPEKDQANAVNRIAQVGEPSRDILIRCDAHADYPQGFLLGVANRLLDRDADSLVIPMDATAERESGPFQRANAFIVDTPLGSGGSAHRGGKKAGWIDHGHHAGFVRQRFLELGGYDPSMVGNEDAEYDTRLGAAGGRIWLEPQLRIRYFPRATAGSLFRQYRRYGQGRARHLVLHRKRPKLRQMIPVMHVIALAVSLALLGLTPWSVVYPLAYCLCLTGVGIWAFAKTKDRAMAFAPLVLATMHTSWGLGFIAELMRGGRNSS